MRTFVVVGANLTGGRAVESLRKHGFDGRIVLVGDEPDRPYYRPPLSKDVLRQESEQDSVFVHPADWYAEHDVDLRLGVRATALDASGSLTLEDGETIDFDRCLLATGGRPRTLDAPGADLDGIHVLRTVRDAAAIGDALQRTPRVVVVGAGFIGAEVAASARELGCEVTMIEMLPVPLQRVLGDELGGIYAQIHRDHGVDLRLGEGVERFDGSGRAERVVGTSGTAYDADLVVVGVGMMPNQELAAGAGIECGNGIIVDGRCRTSAPNVFAAGDVANRPDIYSGRQIRVEHFQNAQHQGTAAGQAMLDQLEEFHDIPWFWSDQYDTNLQMLGHLDPTDDHVTRGDPASREFVSIYLDGDRITGGIAMNRGRDISALKRMMQRDVRPPRDKLADEDVSLKELLSP